MSWTLGSAILICLFWCVCAPLSDAHPLQKDNHDRTIIIRLQKGNTPTQIRVRVEYRLEVHEATVINKDMDEYRDEYPYRKFFPHRAMAYYAHFTRIYEPTYARLLHAEADKKAIPAFRCTSRKESLEDQDGKPLGHLRCDLVFESSFEIMPGKKTHFFFHDQTYQWPDQGQCFVAIVNETGLATDSRLEADESLRKIPVDQLTLAQDGQLRKATLVLAAIPGEIEQAPMPPAREQGDSHDERFSLLRLILHSGYGFWLLMFFAFIFGAAHALTPGHGKTLVAAYLVGERGTVWHALYLGLVTTLTHTGVVLILALVLTLLPGPTQQVVSRWIAGGLGLIMGLIVTCMGFWLLLQRVSGRADHFHIGGDSHHHHAPVADAPGSPNASGSSQVGWWGLTVLGMTGGMIPCWDAVGVLIMSVSSNALWTVLPAVLVFSAGLAVVLVLIGIMVVQVPRFVESRYGSGRLLKALPIVSAILVTLMGLWLCYEGAHAM